MRRVVHIWADPQEEGGSSEGLVQEMQYPPSCMLVKLARFWQGQVEGLEVSTMPLFLVVKMIKITSPKGQKLKVWHWQVTLDGAYAFMDYWAQGQMIEYLWADIRTPLKGQLTPFNAYMTLSRAWGQDNIWLLWDFKDTLFTTTPCEMLEREDKRLVGMHNEMKREWRMRMGHGMGTGSNVTE